MKGLAGLKFSGSPRFQGKNERVVKKKPKKTISPRKSFRRNRGYKEIFSKLEFTPRGFLEPVSCKNRMWIITRADTKKGSKKWSAKNRESVGRLTESPPQSQITKSGPITGIAEKRLVITEAPQNDICPQGNT